MCSVTHLTKDALSIEIVAYRRKVRGVALVTRAMQLPFLLSWDSSVVVKRRQSPYLENKVVKPALKLDGLRTIVKSVRQKAATAFKKH